jgi:hypothetical protein
MSTIRTDPFTFTLASASGDAADHPAEKPAAQKGNKLRHLLDMDDA